MRHQVRMREQRHQGKEAEQRWCRATARLVRPLPLRLDGLRLKGDGEPRRDLLNAACQHFDPVSFLHLCDGQYAHEPVKPWRAREDNRSRSVSTPHVSLRRVIRRCDHHVQH